MTDELIAGFEDFKRYQYDDEDGSMQQLIKDGQAPRYFIISCIDSRANPGTIFRPKPGTFFAHKAMGAIVRPYKQGTALAAALRFAIDYNKVEKIIVLGHTECGAINALIDDIDDDEISSFIEVARHALERAQACTDCTHDIPTRTVKETVLESAKNLMSYPSVRDAVNEGRAEIISWLFDMKAGDLLEYNDKIKKFEVITKHKNTEDSRKDA